MKKDNIKIEFEIISYNLLAENDLIPTEMRILYEPSVDIHSNFLSVVQDIVDCFNISECKEKKCNFYLDNIYEELWKEHFEEELLEELLNNVDKHNYSRFNVTVKELDDQFNLSNKRLKIVIPCNGGNGDMCFFFNSEHKNSKLGPHIHCKYCNIETIIDLDKVEFIDDDFHSISLSELALNTIRRHKEDLIKYFEKVKLDGEKVKFIMTI